MKEYRLGSFSQNKTIVSFFRKRILTSSLLLFACVQPCILHAAFNPCWQPDFWSRFCPFAGVDVKYAKTQGRSNWNNIVHKGSEMGGLYTGFQYNELFGLEFGHEQSRRKQKTHTLGPGDLFFGVSPLHAELHTSAQYSSIYMDVNAYVPLDDPFEGCLDFIYSFGIGLSKPKVRVSVRSIGDPGQALTVDQVDGIQSIHGKWRNIFRVGGGLQYMFTEHFGVRSMLRFESTSRLRVIGNHNFYRQFDYHIQKIFNESYSLSFGLLVKF